jgi:hypothetical protein
MLSGDEVKALDDSELPHLKLTPYESMGQIWDNLNDK